MTKATLHPEAFIASDGKRYLVLNTIATGSYSIIYKAIHENTKQLVAIKTIRFNEPDYPKLKGYFLDCFKQEIKICSELSHPNVVKLIDNGYLKSDEPFAVYEYINGTTLDDFIFQYGTLPGIETKSVMHQVLEALIYLHHKGIVHSDLKPQNIMLTKIQDEIHVTVLDFGSSIKLDSHIKPDNISTLFNLHVLATANYCSPEQLSGTPVDFKSDIYAWGLILIECLTGQPAIEGKTISNVLKNQLNALPATIPAFITEPSLIDLLTKALQKNNDNRLGDAIKIREILNKIAFSDSYIKTTIQSDETAIINKATGIRKIDVLNATSALNKKK